MDEKRRRVVSLLALLGAAPLLLPLEGLAQQQGSLTTKEIPSSGERLPAVGLGSWMTFNVGRDERLRDECTAVVKAFLDSGGRLIDSSPMYGSSQEVIGYALSKLRAASRVFSADKVWISSGEEGPSQIEESRRHWGVPKFDLLQVHNLLAWEDHLPTLFRMRAAGRLRYVGVTTSHGRRHDELERVMKTMPLDFVQLTYNPVDREVERRLLPLARERGIAVIVNRPFQQGDLIRRAARQAIPGWAAETGARTWAQVILKFIISHPSVTCAIPATSNPAHARENLDAARGTTPDEAMRGWIANHLARL
ncbi:MAG TPA: aldo/keto reductase [Gammaproteobacteria bacterium]|nr:aldo/keto reductase [Gammaproteobacteria bacterium]